MNNIAGLVGIHQLKNMMKETSSQR